MDDRYRPLRDYAAIGDGRTVALIGPDASVDWLPIPDIDSPPVFAALLDPDDGGRILLKVDGEYRTRRRYVPGTNVLETELITATGTVRVTDAMVTGVAGRLPWLEFTRRIEGLDGDVELLWSVQPGTVFGTCSPWVERVAGNWVIWADGVSITVVGTAGVPEAGSRSLSGRLRMTAGSRHNLTLVATRDEPLHTPAPAELDAGVDRTVRNWRDWSEVFSYDGPWAEEVSRSALALKLLIFAPSGAIAAAPTTSLPEAPDGSKNWDYRFAWVPDAAYSLRALVRFGLREEPHAAFAWLLETIGPDAEDVDVVYTVRGDPVSDVVKHPVSGWRDIGAVYSGNRAHGQLQLGVYGDLLGIAHAYASAGNILDRGTAARLSRITDGVCDLWRRPDSGMWELTELRHYTSSKMGCWQALNAAIHLCEAGQLTGPVAHWREVREEIRSWIDEHCWSEEAQSYVMYPGSRDLDASVLLHAPSGFDRGERMAATVRAICDELGRGVLLYRFSAAVGSEKPFVACSFWLAAALACVGDLPRAEATMEEAVALANDVGLLSEMVSEDDRSFWGNLPQGLSHLSLIDAAITIERARDDDPEGPDEGT